MTKIKLQSVAQTEKACLFSICFEGESFSEFKNSSPSNPQLSRARRFCQEKKESIEAREVKNRL